MKPSRLMSAMAHVIVACALAVPASAQGKSGKNRGKTPAPPPSTTALPTPAPAASPDGGATAAPFAWMDDASLMAPGSVWLGVSLVRWQGSGLSEVIVPVVDGAIGLAPRVQLSASVPRAAGGLGTTFFSAKIGAYRDEARGLKVAAAPTLEVLGSAAMLSTPPGEGRTHWGVPVSVELNREAGRVYGSTGYFSPGIWYAGAGIGRFVADRIGVSLSFSRAWTTTSSSPGVPAPTSPRRNDLSGGASFEIKPDVAIFGSLGRTIRTSDSDGGGTTLSFGLSLSATSSTLIK